MKKLIALSLIFSAPLYPVTYSPEAVEAQLAAADFIGAIEVERVEPNGESQGIPQSLAHARTSTGEILKIRFQGGEKNDRGVFFSGFVRPYAKRKYQAYLKRVEGDLFEVTGFEWGLRDLSPSRNYSRNRTDGSNGEGNGPFLYWDPKYFPIPYFISEPTFRSRPELIAEIDQSFKSWRDIETTTVEFMAMGCSSGQYNENDGLNSIILVTKNWPFDSAAIAITRNFYVAGSSEHSGLILDSDILLNAVNHQFSIGAETGRHDLRNILTHEVGHFLGLGHEISPVNSDATMYAVASTAETKKQTLGINDIRGAESAYEGVGQKLANHNSVCVTGESNTGCRLGVQHGKPAFPVSTLISFLVTLAVIPFGRYILRREYGSKASERQPN